MDTQNVEMSYLSFDILYSSIIIIILVGLDPHLEEAELHQLGQNTGWLSLTSHLAVIGR